MHSQSYTSPNRESLLADLNPAQREAVTHPAGPLLVVAGAGTGKTRVLTRRVAWLIAGGLPARAVLAITFTNKAAQVLRQRLGALPGGEHVWAGTFHRFCAYLLRRYGDRIGVDPRFTILDREDQSRLLKTLIADLGLKDSGLKPRQAAERIGRLKNAAHDRSVPGLDASGVDAGGLEVAFDRLWDAYHDRLRAGSLLDFDDLLLEAVRLLRDDETTKDALKQQFAHVLVDEYQDTNAVQRHLLLELVGPGRNITVVGDPDQSIYRWRGAVVRNILDFSEDFPGARTLLLEQNYRSTQNILAAAEHVIERNEERHAKRLFSENVQGDLVKEVRCVDAEDEAHVVADVLDRWRAEGRNLSDVAVFYRVNSLSRALELKLRMRQIPYVVVAGVEFFQRREVKDVLAFARLVENPRDDAAFLRVVNVPRRGVGETSLAKLRNAAALAGCSYLECARRGDIGIRGRARAGFAGFVAILDDLLTFPRAPVAPVLEAIVDATGYRAALEDDPDEIERNRIENVNELIAYAREFDAGDPEGGLMAFLERAALVSDQDAYDPEGEGRGHASLMSVHAAKGLEFPLVVITGAELGLFPHARNLAEPAAYEEERRLFYVGLTRAMERLVITHALVRTTYMGREPRSASPFLRDVPADLLEVDDRGAAPGSSGHGGRDLGGHEFGGAWGGQVGDGGRDDYGPRTDTRGDTGLAVGERVVHPHFGAGRLVAISGRGADARVTVEFDAGGRKQMLLRYAKLERAR